MFGLVSRYCDLKVAERPYLAKNIYIRFITYNPSKTQQKHKYSVIGTVPVVNIVVLFTVVATDGLDVRRLVFTRVPSLIVVIGYLVRGF